MVLTSRETAQGDAIDRLNRSPYVDQMVGLLLDEKSQCATGWVVGLTGPWGSGKTRALSLVKTSLEKKIAAFQPLERKRPSYFGGTPTTKPVVIVTFNPWLYSGAGEMISAFFAVLRQDTWKKNKDFPRLAASVTKFARGRKVARAFGMIGDLAKTGFSKAINAAVDITLESEKAELQAAFQEAGASVVVLIDEIDRLSDEEIRTIAQVVKSVADFPMFSYLLAYDPERVAIALGGSDRKLGHHYLEKIVQVQMRLPRVDPGDLVTFAKSEIGPVYEQYLTKPAADKSCPRASLEELTETLRYLVPSVLSTPRDIKRVSGAFEARLALSHDEIEAGDLLRYCALEARVPVLSQTLQARTKRATVDGSRELRRLPLVAFEAESKCIDGILSDFKDEQSLRDLLIAIFPALLQGGPDSVARDDRSLCYETPLLTLLNSGPVSGMVSYSAVDRGLRGDADLFELLEDAGRADRLRHVLLRCRSLLRSQDYTPDQLQRCWRRLGQFFDRPFNPTEGFNWSPWLELTHVLVRGVLRAFLEQHPISATFTKTLIEEGYLHLPATIIFFHLQAHGVEMAPDPGLVPVLTLDDTRKLHEAAVDRWCASIPFDSQWRYRRVYPFWLIYLLKGTEDPIWSFLSSPKDALSLYGIILLLMRSKADSFVRQQRGPDKPVTLDFLIDRDELVGRWRRMRHDDRNPRSPVTTANEFFISWLSKEMRPAPITP